jgi:hypothetical protein
VFRKLLSRAWKVRPGSGKRSNQTDLDAASCLDVNSPHDAFDILRDNVRVVRKERLAQRVPPHQRGRSPSVSTQSS